MKLLIELDEEYVKAIDKIKFLVGGRTDRKLQLEIIKAIKNGKALEQEPFINKPCVSSGVCEHDKNKVLDRVRAEIEELKPNNPNFKGYFEQNVALNKALEIIDKYKGESEG